MRKQKGAEAKDKQVARPGEQHIADSTLDKGRGGAPRAGIEHGRSSASLMSPCSSSGTRSISIPDRRLNAARTAADGEVLAVASRLARGTATPGAFASIFEPGSTAKIFAAAALYRMGQSDKLADITNAANISPAINPIMNGLNFWNAFTPPYLMVNAFASHPIKNET